MTSFPWKRGDGTINVTVCLKKILDPIVSELRSENKLSERISELLWLHYGESNIEEEESKLNIMIREKEMLENKIKNFENDVMSRRDNKNNIERKNELDNQIKDFRKIKNHIKNNPNGRWQYNQIGGLRPNEVILAKEMVSTYGGESGFLDEYSSWEIEREELILKIGQKAAKKK